MTAGTNSERITQRDCLEAVAKMKDIEKDDTKIQGWRTASLYCFVTCGLAVVFLLSRVSPTNTHGFALQKLPWAISESLGTWIILYRTSTKI
jgi:hypothetical protein